MDIYVLVAAATVLYTAGLLLWRLFLHPLARFPGPRLAAATGWYEAYFELIKRPGGIFMFEVDRLHDVYGPIVRINPHEIHVRDPEWIDKLYIGPTQGLRDKYPPAAYMVGTPLGIFGTISHSTHKRRRAAVSPFFSKASVTSAESLIQEKVGRLLERMGQQFAEIGYAEMRKNFLAFATDTLCEHTFSESMDLLMDEQKAADWYSTSSAVTANAPLVKQFTWVMPLVLWIPVTLLMKIDPRFGRVMALRRDMLRQSRIAIKNHKAGTDQSVKGKRKTVFESILGHTSLPPIEKCENRLAQEGFLTIAAGGETTGRVLSTALFFVLENRSTVLPRLLSELRSVKTEPETQPTWKELEGLPWLGAVIQESLRITSLITSRLPLVSPNTDLQYKDFTIPAGTPVSMSLRDILLDGQIFQEPLQFRPERWLPENPDLGHITKYQVPFGRGSRMCVGMNLALAELHIALARVFLAFDLELFDTNRARDIEIIRDCFSEEINPLSKGVRVRPRQERC